MMGFVFLHVSLEEKESERLLQASEEIEKRSG